jgi:hypothetical protein
LPSHNNDNGVEIVGFIKRYRWPIVAAGLAGLVVAFLLFRPDKLFVDDVVDESLADAFGVPVATTAASPTTTTRPPEVTTEAPSSTAAPNETPPTTSAPTPSTTAAPKPTAPVAIGTGGFYGIDHEAEGTATVYEQDGRFVLRFEDDTDIQNGPDLWVWVLEATDYGGGDPGEFIELGKLKGNVGGQNYELPAEFDPDLHQFVLIWCKRFSVPFAAAPLA